MTRDSASRLRRASSSATSIWRRSSAAFSSMNLWGTPLGFSVALTRRSHNSCGEERSIGEREGKVDQRTNRDARRAVGEVRRKRSTGNNNARRAHLHESRRVLLQECQELAVDGCSALVHLLLLEEIVNHRYQHVVLDGQQLGDARRDQGLTTSHLTRVMSTRRSSSGGCFRAAFLTLTPLTMPPRLKG